MTIFLKNLMSLKYDPCGFKCTYNFLILVVLILKGEYGFKNDQNQDLYSLLFAGM